MLELLMYGFMHIIISKYYVDHGTMGHGHTLHMAVQLSSNFCR